jgi:uncharacterized protein GlcG (DUF336 family)
MALLGRLRQGRSSAGSPRIPTRLLAAVEGLETRALLAAAADLTTAAASPPPPLLTAADVNVLLSRAAAATGSNDAIIAVVDRQGNPLGVRIESGVAPEITGNVEKKVFAIDGALAEARTAAFFASDQAPLTSRTIQDISQSTMTQREIQADPNIPDPNSPLKGPGYVAPVGKKGHFPPRIMFTPQVDLFQIEHTNRDSILHTGADNNRSNLSNDILLPARFNADPKFIPPGQSISAPESYGFVSGQLVTAQGRGIGTLPGGVPIFKSTADGNFKNTSLVGGIGVFFPGKTGFATEENSNLNDAGFYDPTKPDRSVEAEYMAFVAAGGAQSAGLSTNTPAFNQAHNLPSFPANEMFNLPFGRIDLVGITLDVFGGHGLQGPKNLINYGRTLGIGNPQDGTNQPIDPQGDTLKAGVAVPSGWLVLPHDSADGTLTAADVTEIINRGVREAGRVRAAIRLPLDRTAKMIISVTDKSGNILGLFRMPDTTYFSIDVAVAKARNVAYYANAAQLQPVDQLAGVPPGVALTNRTFRYLSLPHFPEGIDTYPSGPFSILNEVGIRGSLNKPASSFQTVQGFDSFNPTTNFHDPFNIKNQNGIVFFPGSSALYKDVNGTGQKVLVGGMGVSGDGVDQDDDVTFQAAVGFTPPPNVGKADQFFLRGVRLPYQKFNRQPHEPIQPEPQPTGFITPPKPGGTVGIGARAIRRIQVYNAGAIADLKSNSRFGNHLKNQGA